MMLGYANRPEQTAEAVVDGWYRTGDGGRIDEEGYLYLTDRIKDMIVTGGENVYSKEVEDVLAGHPSLAEVAVIGVPHPEWGESVTAIIVPQAGANVTLEEMQTYCEARLAKYKIPRRLKVVQALPRTPTGKVMKYQLRQQAASA